MEGRGCHSNIKNIIIKCYGEIEKHVISIKMFEEMHNFMLTIALKLTLTTIFSGTFLTYYLFDHICWYDYGVLPPPPPPTLTKKYTCSKFNQ